MATGEHADRAGDELMALTVTRAKVKEKAALTTTTYDATIDGMITEMLPAIEYAIEQRHVDDTGNGRLQATLNLAATELIAGELTAQIAREPGASDSFYFGWFQLTAAPKRLSDPFGLKAQGAARLYPYAKSPQEIEGLTGVYSGGSRQSEEA
ncbi:MAG: hypothetical protein KIT11_09125 [Fimbriimonadaceae bacterium]|nr:hypothetical protein [Fimbriimonadaceae bacterium]QYK55489.1 MAG: hypothetical protein KF733_10795 [Fimbriimonadaceae bacterium]